MKFQKISAIALALVLGVTLGGCSSNKTTQAPEKSKIGTAVDGSEIGIEKATITFSNDFKKGGYELISTEELKKKIDAKEQMVIVDTMPASSFSKNHIPGAVNAELPKDGIEKVTPEQKQAFLKALGEDKNKAVVVYCGFVGCARSDVGAVIAKEAGFKTVYRQPGGIVSWMEAGYPVEK